jgi:peptidoglycan lytic transglycosylase G
VKRIATAIGLLAFVAAAGVAAAGFWGLHLLRTPHGPPGTVEFVIARGESAGGILDRLEETGLLPDATLARLYLVYVLGDPALRAGEYAIPSPATADEIFSRLARGEVVLHQATIIEGLTLEETAEQLAAQGFGNYDALVAVMRSTELVADLDPQAETLEGYLFPETYSFPRGVSEGEIVEKMVATFRLNVERALSGVSTPPALREVVILASIVEKEALLDSERPIIAGVYRNRLVGGIGLYADPTIIFALKQLGTWDGDIRRRDLDLDSPYNTYRYPGLPPGPICSPGLASLRAAAAPAKVPFLYFVSRNDGSHVFAETLSEHNRNVDEWQRRYWRRQRAEPPR